MDLPLTSPESVRVTISMPGRSSHAASWLSPSPDRAVSAPGPVEASGRGGAGWSFIWAG